MSPLTEFLELLLHDGRMVLPGPPEPADAGDREAVALLQRAFADYRLEVAGPLLELSTPTALAAARVVHWAGWFLVSHQEPEAELEKHLRMPAPPRSSAEHLSADLLLRFLPHVYRRAHALDPGDRLPALLADVLRQWPLSGVLSSVTEPPTTPLDFGGHPGLLLLYAERLAANPRPAWLPAGAGREYVELVWTELGKDATLLYESVSPPHPTLSPKTGHGE